VVVHNFGVELREIEFPATQVDGPYCAVRFPATGGSNSSGKDSKEEDSYL
jgi:hypothetical protein